jgi:aspartyl-tRNA(Asn)/glutamyl-tRNA(Gln) amidotransferase subunit A
MASPATDPADLGVLDAGALLRSGDLSAIELLDACLARIGARNGGPPTFDGAPGAVNAWARLYPDLARVLARAADARRAAQGRGAPALCGVPLALKDLFAVAGLPLTASSRVLEGDLAQEDSVAWRRLLAQGMVLLGHTHTHEFAAGGTTDQVGNPWAPERTAGGSSGGSAAALAAGMVPAALGTDTAGSVRIPAALSGVCAIKPARGRVPLEGVVPLAASLDHVGPMARTVADCSAVLGALEPSLALGITAPRPGARPLDGLRVAVTERPRPLPVEDDVRAGLEAARAACVRLGAEVVELPAADGIAPEDAVAILFTEVWEHHERFADRADRYRASIREFVEAGRAAHAGGGHAAAQKRREQVAGGWRAWFAEHRVDLLLEPTVPMTAPARGEGYDSGHLGGEGDPLIVLTSTWNFTGFPVVALPAGLGPSTGLPVGVSLVAPADEAVAVQAAIDLQAHELEPLGIAPGL